MDLVLQKLREDHLRKSFRCGQPTVDDFFRNRALDEGEPDTWVLVRSDSLEVIAFYSLHPNPHDFVTDDVEDPPEPVLNLEYLGVHEDWQGQGIGEELLTLVMEEALHIADHQDQTGCKPIRGITGFALPKHKRWFLDRGFYEVTPGNPRILLPLERIRALLRC